LVSDIKGGTQLRVLENRVLWRIFGPKMDEVIREWRKLHSEELYNLVSLPSIIRMITSRMRSTRHVARMGRSLLMGKPEERDHREDKIWIGG
jgi:hypothetical protein